MNDDTTNTMEGSQAVGETHPAIRKEKMRKNSEMLQLIDPSSVSATGNVQVETDSIGDRNNEGTSRGSTSWTGATTISSTAPRSLSSESPPGKRTIASTQITEGSSLIKCRHTSSSDTTLSSKDNPHVATNFGLDIRAAKSRIANQERQNKSSKKGSLHLLPATMPGAVSEIGSHVAPINSHPRESHKPKGTSTEEPTTTGKLSKKGLAHIEASSVPSSSLPSSTNTSCVPSIHPERENIVFPRTGANLGMSQVVVAHLAPTDEDVEARVAAQLRNNIQQEYEQAMNAKVVYPTTTATEPSGCFRKRTTICLVLFLSVAIIVGAIVIFKRYGAATDTIPYSELLNTRRESLSDTLQPHIASTYLLEDRSSPQGRAFQWLVEKDQYTLHSERFSSAQVLLERYILAVLYYAMSGTSWANEFPFLDETKTVCEWNNGGTPGEEETAGVYCTDSTKFGIVTFLRLHLGGGLTGSIPIEIGLLTNLQHLALDGNSLTGTLPSEIGNLSDLQVLTLADNAEVLGTVPVEWGNLTSLNLLSLTNTTLTGSLDALFCPISNPAIDILADCEGESPELICSCCQVCCSSHGSYCQTNSFDTPAPTRIPSGTWYPTPAPSMLPTWPYVTQYPTVDVSFRRSFLLETLGTLIVLNDTSEEWAKFDDLRYPQAQALQWMSRDDYYTLNLESIAVDNLLERYVLTVFYFALNGVDWSNGFPFVDATKDVCAWNNQDEENQEDDIKGAYCDSVDDNSTFVTHLNLQGLGMSGEIPWEVSLLQYLVVCQLDHNALTGPLPLGLGNLPILTTLSLSFNFLSGGLPSTWTSSLKELVVTSNSLSGTIPSGLGSAALKLEYLECGLNHFEGTIPSELMTLSFLRRMDFEGNHLIGSIPTEIGWLSSVKYLFVEKNMLSGTLPSEIGDLSELQVLYVYGNTGLTGTIPEEFDRLQYLQSFSFENTSLTGSVESIFCPISDTDNLVLYGDCLESSPEIECSCCAVCCEADGGNCHFMIYTDNIHTGKPDGSGGRHTLFVACTTTMVLIQLFLFQ